MSLVSVTESSLENIAAAIRNKKGGTDKYTPGQMAGAINGIHTADEVVLVQKSITANGTYNPAGDSANGYSGVSVNVANSYTSADNGKVVSNQQLVAQTSKQITQNGTHDTTTNNSVSVAVPNSYSASDNGKVVVNQALVAQTSKNINANGTHDTTANNSVVVDVPNSYAAADEGKVVSGGALVGQTSRNVTANGTYDTTENNEVVVNVQGGGGGGETVTRKATYIVGGTTGTIIESELSQTIEMHSESTDYIVPTVYGQNYAFKKNVPFEICCKFQLLSSPSSNGEQIWGGTDSYYDYPGICVFPNKIVYYVSTNGGSWQYNAVPITPSDYTTPINTIIIARLTYDGSNFTFYINDGSNEYTSILENVTPAGNARSFEFGGQNKSSYSIAKLGCIIYLDETYIKFNGETAWPVGKNSLTQKTITQNGTYNASDENADGYSQIIVNVGGGTQESDNDILFHFDNSFKHSGNRDALFCNLTGLDISDEQSKFGGTSLKTGSSQVIRNAYLSYDFQFGSNDFTVDFWCYPTNLVNRSSGYKVPIAFPYRSLAFYLATDSMQFGTSKYASSWFNIDEVPVIIDNNQWHHIAIVRNGTNVYGYLNGVKVKTVNFGNDSWASLNEHSLTFGSNTYDNGDRRFVGYIDEFRVKIGEAVWTDDFTPPTTPYE